MYFVVHVRISGLLQSWLVLMTNESAQEPLSFPAKSFLVSFLAAVISHIQLSEVRPLF